MKSKEQNENETIIKEIKNENKKLNEQIKILQNQKKKLESFFLLQRQKIFKEIVNTQIKNKN